MLVYANYLPIRTTAGVRDPLAPVADWLSYRLRRPIGVDEVLSGGEFQNRYGWTACSLALTDRYPHVAAVELVHPDDEVRGRQWHSEITLQQPSVGADVAPVCSSMVGVTYPIECVRTAVGERGGHGVWFLSSTNLSTAADLSFVVTDIPPESIGDTGGVVYGKFLSTMVHRSVRVGGPFT